MPQDHVAIKTPEFVSLKFNLAGLGSRASAMIIDQILLMIVNIVTILLLSLSISGTFGIGSESFLVAFAIIFLFIVRWGYFFVCEYFFGGKTIGKKIVGIRVIQENGHSITLVSSIIRNLLRIIDMLPSGYFIGIIMVFFHPRHKRLGDIVSGTIVVHEREAKKKESHIEKAIESRRLSKESLPVSDLDIKSLGAKEWKLLKTYSERMLQLEASESMELTNRMAVILLPKVNLRVKGRTIRELENILLVLYLVLRDEWEYEL